MEWGVRKKRPKDALRENRFVKFQAIPDRIESMG